MRAASVADQPNAGVEAARTDAMPRLAAPQGKTLSRAAFSTLRNMRERSDGCEREEPKRKRAMESSTCVLAAGEKSAG